MQRRPALPAGPPHPPSLPYYWLTAARDQGPARVAWAPLVVRGLESSRLTG